MKEKILNALKTEYKNLGLSAKAFDGVAEFYSKTITEESQIEEKIKEAEPMLKMIQGEADRVRNDSQSSKTELEKQIEELKEKLEAKPTDPTKPNGGDGKGENAELAELKATLLGLQEKLEEGDKASIKQAALETAKNIMLEKGVDKKLCDKMLSLATLEYSETDTAEVIAERGVKEYNEFVTGFTPEAGVVESSVQGGGDTALQGYFATKKAEKEAREQEVSNLKN